MRVYKPSGDSESTGDFIALFSQGELVLGSFALFVGGFYYRVTNDLSVVVVGGTLVLLAVWHLLVEVESDHDGPQYETDRLYIRLKRQLPDGYTLAFDVPVEDKQVDYVILGHSGVFLAHRLEKRGRIDGNKSDDEWTVRGDDGNTEHIKNPFHVNRSITETVEPRLEEAVNRPVTVYNLVVLMYQNVEGTILEIPEVRRLGEVAEYVETKTDESGESWSLEEDRAIKETLKLSSY